MHRTNIVFWLFLVVITFLSGYAVMGNSTKSRNMNDSNNQKYYFEMAEKAQEEFLKKLNSIKIGDSVQKVKNILGEPTYDQIGASKKGEFISRDFTYYIKILEKGLVNEKYDQYVELSFDAKNKLTKIESNIPVEILIPFTLDKERKLQKEAGEGHQPWRLNPIDMARSAVISYANKNIKSKKCFLITQKNNEAIAQCNNLNVNYRVYLKKYFGKSSIWTATKIQIIKN